MNIRELKGRELAARLRIQRDEHGIYWLVPSQTSRRVYKVTIDDGAVPTCTCGDYELHGMKCKHIYAVEHFAQADMHRTPREPIPPRPTYRQDWPAYNQAQTHEKAHFQTLLFDLCQSIPQPPYVYGRPRLPFSEMVFAAAFKVYSTVSTRRFMTDLADAQAKGYLSRVPHFNSILNYLELPELTPILRCLIEQTALVMKAFETHFAVDSSGFSTCGYTRWYSHKYGHEQEVHDWMKVHLTCGVTTNIVTAVEITGSFTNDTTMFPALVEGTARNFAVQEVSADRAYSTRKNLEFVVGLGATPYIPFKAGTTANGTGSAVWAQLYHFFHLHRAEFLEHYHRRSLSESTFAMIKAKFGAAIRCKGDMSQLNELLCKVLCHNICVVIQSMYEVGIEPDFGPSN